MNRDRGRGLAKRARAVAIGLAADALIGEPPDVLHPVAAFGGVMGSVESWLYAPARTAGVGYTALGIAFGAAVGSAVSSAGATWIAVAGRELRAAARQVAAALDRGDLDAARRALPALVGRDVAGLEAQEIARATIESVAENTVDAIVAPALWGLALGGPGALGFRALNTLDATVGHRSARYAQFGWASARLDDAANLLPARAVALLVAAVRPSRARSVVSVVRRHAGAHPSPNAGVAEAAFAAALGLRLGGTNSYGGQPDVRPMLGDGRSPAPRDIERACVLSRDVSIALAGVLGAVWLWGAR